MKYEDLELPDDLLPDAEWVKEAEERDANYESVYDELMSGTNNATADMVIGLMAKFETEKVALLIGADLRPYDKQVLMGVIGRHIAEKVFKG